MTSARKTLGDFPTGGKWIPCVVAVIVFYAVMIGFDLVVGWIPIIGQLAIIAVAGPMTLGLFAYFLETSRGGSPDVKVLFSGLRNFVKALCLLLLMWVIILIGMILLIIPGIIACLALSMSFFIMIDNPEMGVVDVAKASYDMMAGNKWKLFCLGCRFIGWGILCIFTLCIGCLWLVPYEYVSFAKFYDEINGRVAAQAPEAPAAPAAPQTV